MVNKEHRCHRMISIWQYYFFDTIIRRNSGRRHPTQQTPCTSHWPCSVTSQHAGRQNNQQHRRNRRIQWVKIHVLLYIATYCERSKFCPHIVAGLDDILIRASGTWGRCCSAFYCNTQRCLCGVLQRAVGQECFFFDRVFSEDLCRIMVGQALRTPVSVTVRNWQSLP